MEPELEYTNPLDFFDSIGAAGSVVEEVMQNSNNEITAKWVKGAVGSYMSGATQAWLGASL